MPGGERSAVAAPVQAQHLVPGVGRDRAEKKADLGLAEHCAEIGRSERHGDEIRVKEKKARRIVEAGRNADPFGCRHLRRSEDRFDHGGRDHEREAAGDCDNGCVKRALGHAHRKATEQEDDGNRFAQRPLRPIGESRVEIVEGFGVAR